MSNLSTETQTCHTCGEVKSISLFPKWRLKCKACKSAENGARLKERYANDPKMAEATKQRAAEWQRENAERSNEYHRRRHEKKIAGGDAAYVAKMSAAQRRYRDSDKGKATIAARGSKYVESGQDKAWRKARAARPESRASQILAGARNRAVKKNIECNLTFDDVYPAIVAGRCPKTGLAFDLTPHEKLRRNPLAPSPDQINPGRGYVRGNVQVVCDWYNNAKQQLTDAKMLAFCRAVVDNAPKPDV